MLRPELLTLSQPVDVAGSVNKGILNFQQAQAFEQAQEKGALQNQILQQSMDDAEMQRELESIIGAADVVEPLISSNDPEKLRQAANFLSVRSKNLAESGFNSEDTDEVLNLINQGDTGTALNLIREVRAIGKSKGIGKQQSSLESQDRAQLLGQIEPYRTETGELDLKALEKDPIAKAAAIKLRLVAGAVGSSAQTIAETGKTEEVAGSQATIEGRKEEAKLASQLELKPIIESSILKSTSGVTRLNGFMDAGLTASSAIPKTQRAIELLESVKTSGLQKALLNAKEMFGVAGADESELSNNLGINVIRQLREVFGPQFTEKDREAFERMEAGFGKSPEGNKRILRNVLKTLENIKSRGINAAKSIGDDFMVEEFNRAASVKFGDKKPISELSDDEFIKHLEGL